jgi:hypothetical protein
VSLVVGSAADVVRDPSVVVVSGGVVEVEVVEDVEAGGPVVLELPAVASGGAAVQETTSKTAATAVERAKETVRTGVDGIPVHYSPRWNNHLGMRQHSPTDERHHQCCSQALFRFDRVRRIVTAISPPS